MCGIAGIVSLDGWSVPPERLENMALSLSHRGPDDEGFLCYNVREGRARPFKREQGRNFKGELGLAHRRLSIIDLSRDASQPMVDVTGRFWIVHNGEIFNYIEIRRELESRGYEFRTESDTEVILNAYRLWGEDCLPRFNGMWAFALLDCEKRTLFAARDRFGIKPFFYHTDGRICSFASEIKALLTLPWIHPRPFLPAVKDYLYFSRVDTSTRSFFEGIHSLPPGGKITLDLQEGECAAPSLWWDLPEFVEKEGGKAAENPPERFRELLLDSVGIRLRSDVPVGTCLSGGLDSSAIVALANPLLREGNQRTFSIVQPGYAYDESAFIDEVIHRFSVIPARKAIGGEDLLSDLDRVIRSHDEPFTSTSMYAQWKVFELAKKSGVTVTLDGQGADEMLAGYPYFKLVYRAHLLSRLRFQAFFREAAAGSGDAGGFIGSLVSSAAGFFPHRRMIALAGLRDAHYRTDWIQKETFAATPLPHAPIARRFRDGLNQRLYEVFSFDGLPALLRYADRNSMTHGLESRMPFMDYRLVGYLFSLGGDWKIRQGWSKYIMREGLKADVPEAILKRRDKVGFMTHESEWFRGPMKEALDSVFKGGRITRREWYRRPALLRMYDRHQRGDIDASRPLWRVFNLERWMAAYMENEAS